ncbi:MAG: 5-dehydro-2-deoxygluconokinase [Verrucomicrobiota bacterium]
MAEKNYDVLTVGRSSIDLYSNDIGAPFVDISSFGAFVGGSPLNIATGLSRLGMRSALLSGVGQDQVGDFILNFLRQEGVETRFLPRIEGARSSAVVLGIEPPDRFPLVFYRDNCADSQINIDHVVEADVGQFKVLETSGTALNKEPSRSAVFFAVEEARREGVTVVHDLDFRNDQWHDTRAFGVTTRALLPRVDVAVGTEEEVLATVLQDPSQVTIRHQQVSAPEIKGDLDEGIRRIQDLGVETLIVKRGALGASYFRRGEDPVDVPGFPVDIVNILGAGDAFATGLIYGILKGWDWYRSCRMGNACGAVVVTRHGCANFMPFEKELLEFVEAKGGF